MIAAIVLAAACIVAGGVAWELHAALEAMPLPHAPKAPDGLEAEARTLTQSLARIRTAAKSKPSATAAVAPDPSGAPRPPSAKAVKKAMVAVAKWEMDPVMAGIYSRLSQSLNLSAEQIDALRDLTAERAADAYEAMRKAGSDKTDIAMVAGVMTAAMAPADAKIQALLGQAGYQQFQQQMQTASASLLVQKLYAGTVSDPITASQQEQLAAALTPTQPDTFGKPVGLLQTLMGRTTVTVSEQAVAQAQSFLTPEQTAVLRQAQAVAEARSTVLRMYQATLAQLKSAAAAAPAQ